MTSVPLTATQAAAVVAGNASARLRPDGGAVLAMAGAVSVGKSTFASAIVTALTAQGLRAEAVSTDGFLFPGAVLRARGLMERKGFPESYDVDALQAFVAAVQRGAAELPVPEYSHELYDVLPGVTRRLPRVDVLVLEGVNALSATAGAIDVGVYLDAAPDVLEAWYVDRFRAYCVDPAPGSFYAAFAALDPDGIDGVAREVWQTINVPNLRDFIEPSRRYADLVVEKLADHRVRAVLEQARR